MQGRTVDCCTLCDFCSQSYQLKYTYRRSDIPGDRLACVQLAMTQLLQICQLMPVGCFGQARAGIWLLAKGNIINSITAADLWCMKHKEKSCMVMQNHKEHKCYAMQHRVDCCRADTLLSCRYKAAMQEAQARSRSLTVAMQSVQRKSPTWQLITPNVCQQQQVQQSSSVFKSALRRPTSISPGRAAVDKLRPMTASSIMQTISSPAGSAAARPASASGR